MLKRKEYFTKILVIFVICVAWLVQEVNGKTNKNNQKDIQSIFLSMNWDINSNEGENINKVNKKQILNIFNELLPEKYDKFEMSEIGDYYFDDVNNDGIYEIIVKMHISAVVDYLSVICKVGNSINVKHFDKSYRIQDIDGDGNKEILTHTFLAYKTWTIGEGNVIWSDIYQWDGKKFVLSNTKFPSFFHKKIAEYKKMLAELEKFNPVEETDKRIKDDIKSGKIKEAEQQKKYDYLLETLQRGKETAIESCQKAIKMAEDVLQK